jgi:hypothetical protein
MRADLGLLDAAAEPDDQEARACRFGADDAGNQAPPQ